MLDALAMKKKLDRVLGKFSLSFVAVSIIVLSIIAATALVVMTHTVAPSEELVEFDTIPEPLPPPPLDDPPPPPPDNPVPPDF